MYLIFFFFLGGGGGGGGGRWREREGDTKWCRGEVERIDGVVLLGGRGEGIGKERRGEGEWEGRQCGIRDTPCLNDGERETLRVSCSRDSYPLKGWINIIFCIRVGSGFGVVKPGKVWWCERCGS